MKIWGALALAMTLLPSAARADGLIIPFIGADFGGDANQCKGVTPCSEKQLTYGVGIGFMVGGVIGFEGEFAHAPHFFGEGDARGDNYVLTVMANVMAGVPIGPVRPYVVGGLGILHTDVSKSSVGLFDAYANNSPAFDAGGGLMGFFSTHVGLRGDLRFIRTLDQIDVSQFDLPNKHLEFWRGSIGVALRF